MRRSIDDLHAGAHSPDGQVHAEISGRRDVRVWFEPGHVARTSTAVLEMTLQQVLARLYVARMRAYWELQGRPVADPVAGPPRLMTSRREAIAKGVLGIHAEGEHGGVRIATVGMQGFTVDLPESVVRSLDEHALGVAIGRAACYAQVPSDLVSAVVRAIRPGGDQA